MSPPFALLLAEQAVQEFFKRWCAGLQPCLLLETNASGEIFVSSKVTCGVPQQSEQADWPHSNGQPHHRLRQGPARLRRRARRAHARATAEAAAKAAATAPKKPNTAVEAFKPLETEVVAAKAVVEELIAAVEANRQPQHQTSDDAPVAEHTGCPQEPAEQAGSHHQQVCPAAAAQVVPVSHQVRDEFCLDDFYKILQEQTKPKENQTRDLSEKSMFGFKRDCAKKPF